MLDVSNFVTCTAWLMQKIRPMFVILLLPQDFKTCVYKSPFTVFFVAQNNVERDLGLIYTPKRFSCKFVTCSKFGKTV